MDKIKGIFNDINGGDSKLDGDDLKNVDVNELKKNAEDLGIGKYDVEALTKLSFPLEKNEVVSNLKAAGVSDQLVGLVEKVPDQLFENLDQLRAKLPF